VIVSQFPRHEKKNRASGYPAGIKRDACYFP
jgi:hypothetical protein